MFDFFSTKMRSAVVVSWARDKKRRISIEETETNRSMYVGCRRSRWLINRPV